MNKSALLTKYSFFGIFFIRYCSLAVIISLIVSCGGGIVGSGNGGGSPSPSAPSLPSLPGPAQLFQISAAFLDGTAPNEYDAILVGEDWFDIQLPYQTVQGGLARLTEHVSPYTLSLIYFTFLVPSVTSYCSNVPVDMVCQADEPDISIDYTEEIAEQEIEIRESLELTELLSPEQRDFLQASIRDEADKKMGSQIRVESLVYDRTSPFQSITFVLGESIPDFELVRYTVEFHASQEFSNSIAYSKETAGKRLSMEFQNRYVSEDREVDPVEVLFMIDKQQELLSYNVKYQTLQLNNIENSLVVSEITHTSDTLVQTINSIGLTAGSQNYLRSQAFPNADFLETELLYREAYDQTRLARSICRPATTGSSCGANEDWIIISGVDPIESILYKSIDELEQLTEELRLRPSSSLVTTE